MLNSQRKGKTFELLAAHLLSDLTHEEFKRLGGREKDRIYLSGDITPVSPDSYYRQYHWEVKGQKKLKINEWLNKAIDDAGNRLPTVLAWDFKYKRWIISLEAERFIRILKELK